MAPFECTTTIDPPTLENVDGDVAVAVGSDEVGAPAAVVSLVVDAVVDCGGRVVTGAVEGGGVVPTGAEVTGGDALEVGSVGGAAIVGGPGSATGVRTVGRPSSTSTLAAMTAAAAAAATASAAPAARQRRRTRARWLTSRSAPLTSIGSVSWSA